MSEGIVELRKEFESLVNEAKALLEEVERDRYVRLNEESWYRLTSEEKSCANTIRSGIRCLLTRLAAPVQSSPLLDNRDIRRFVRLGRAMDAALHFRTYRRTGVSDPDEPPKASWVFNDASEELAELLDLIPEQCFSSAPEAQAEARARTTEECSPACERTAEGETPPAPVAS
jgi:hypothetical protein